MAKHEAMRVQLDNWARWVTEGVRAGLGYPRASPFTRMTPRSSSTDNCHIPVDDVAARRLHDRIEALRLVRSELYLVVHCRWVGDPRVPSTERRVLGAGECAELMGVAPSTHRRHIDEALTLLSDQAGGFTH